MKLYFDDRIRVLTSPVSDVGDGRSVEITLTESTGYLIQSYASAAQARKLARKLLAAADEIDPPAIAPTHYALEPAAPRAIKVGDLVLVAAGAKTVTGESVYFLDDHEATPATVLKTSGGWGFGRGDHPDDMLVRVVANRHRQSVAPQYVTLAPSADAPDVDPAEPHGGCCGGGC